MNLFPLELCRKLINEYDKKIQLVGDHVGERYIKEIAKIEEKKNGQRENSIERSNNGRSAIAYNWNTNWNEED